MMLESTRLLCIAAAGLVALEVRATEGAISLPYTNSFEVSEHSGYYVGYPMANQPGWGMGYGMTGATVVAGDGSRWGQSRLGACL